MGQNRMRNRGYSKDGMRMDRRNNVTYVYGNTVRKSEHYWEEPEAAPAVKKQRNREVLPKENRHYKARKNRDKARYMNAGYVVFLAAALCAAAFILVNYVQLQAQLTNLTKTVAARQSELNSLKVDNDEEYNRIISGIDLEEIKRIAISELGMVYAQEGQIVEYANESADYMRQVTGKEQQK